ncbi:hypothetical protein B0H10DRAFT_2159746 [Mycena sp. CBHHK59/15]|nr:hypothetical protein B0H10DRAFT_2159746 [Mycena sp. CBHHK59/15]
MQISVDLSHKLEPGMQVYPGDPLFSCTRVASIEKDSYAVQALSMGSHTGTHVDAPAHFFLGGKTIEQIPLTTFIGPALVIDLTHKGPREPITWDDDLAAYAPQMRAGRGAAEHIIATGVQVVGVDALSPDETRLDGAGSFGAHEVILGAGCIIAENLTNLDAIDSLDYVVHLVPLNITGSDGSPVRAFALKNAYV